MNIVYVFFSSLLHSINRKSTISLFIHRFDAILGKLWRWTLGFNTKHLNMNDFIHVYEFQSETFLCALALYSKHAILSHWLRYNVYTICTVHHLSVMPTWRTLLAFLFCALYLFILSIFTLQFALWFLIFCYLFASFRSGSM